MSSTMHLQLNMNQPSIHKTNYQSLIGGLLHASIISWPDICFIVNILSQYNQHLQERKLISLLFFYIISKELLILVIFFARQ